MAQSQINATEKWYDEMNEVANLQEEILIISKLLKSDFTGWNIVEAIENLSFELKRLNDREESKK